MMAFGFVLFSLSVCFSDGVYLRFIEQFIRERTGHIQIHSKGYLENPKLFKRIKNYNVLMEGLKSNKNILHMAPRVHSGGLAFYKNKSMGVEIVGVDFDLESKATTFKKRFKASNVGFSKNENRAIIGKSVAKILKIGFSDPLVLISSAADGSIANDIFKVVGIMESKERSIDDHRIYLPLKQAQEYYALENSIHELALILSGNQNPKKITIELQKEIGPQFKVEVNPWQVVEKDFYKAMQADKKGDYVGQFIFILVMGVGVLNTLLMSIIERTQEFGILKALGTRSGHIAKIIFAETFILSVISIGLGSILSTAVNFYFSTHGIELETPIAWGGATFSKMLGMMNARTYWQPSLIIFVTGIMVTLIPAWRAKKVSPADAMRTI